MTQFKSIKACLSSVGVIYTVRRLHLLVLFIYSRSLDKASCNSRRHLCDINILRNMQLLSGKHFVRTGSLTSIATLTSVSSLNVITVLVTTLISDKQFSGENEHAL